MKIKATFLHIFLCTLVIALTGCANSERKGIQEEKTFDLMKATGPDIQKVVLGLIAYGPPTTIKRKAQIATEFTQDGRSHASQLKRLGRTEDEIYSIMAKKYDLDLSAEVNRWHGTLFTLSSEGTFIIPASIPGIYKENKLVIWPEIRPLDQAKFLKLTEVPRHAYTKEELAESELYGHKYQELRLTREGQGLSDYGTEIIINDKIDFICKFEFPRDRLETLIMSGRSLRAKIKYVVKLEPRLKRDRAFRTEPELEFKVLTSNCILEDLSPRN